MKYILLSLSTVKYFVEEGQSRYKVVVEQADKSIDLLCNIESMILGAINNHLKKNANVESDFFFFIALG